MSQLHTKHILIPAELAELFLDFQAWILIEF